MPTEAKICGLKTAETVAAAVTGGAAMVGFVFFPASPRYVTPGDAGALTAPVPAGVIPVGLVVDADDALLAEIVAQAGVGLLQLHGHETPERTAEIRQKFGLPVMKVLPVSDAADVAAAKAYETVADRLMFDAKPPKDATRPGGNALSFDWRLLAGHTWGVPWMLAGGLTPANVADAVRISGAPMVDVSSGVEEAPGVKNLSKIADFLAAVKSV